jgi:hypothetical protein
MASAEIRAAGERSPRGKRLAKNAGGSFRESSEEMNSLAASAQGGTGRVSKAVDDVWIAIHS